jgi:hypothetical protein
MLWLLDPASVFAACRGWLLLGLQRILSEAQDRCLHRDFSACLHIIL